jgi:hypothetical protein
MTVPVTFPNWQSKWLLGGLARSQPLSPVELPRPLERFLEWYERAFLRVDVSRVKIDRPIFLLGTPRSGTTMLQDILCSHESVGYVNNTMHRFPTRFCAVEHCRRLLGLDFEAERYLSDSVRVSAGSPSDTVGLWAEWFGVDPYSLKYTELGIGDLPAGRVERMKDTIRRAIWCYGEPYRRFFSKLLAVLPYTHLIRDLFPDARFIHILRDARFTANSMVKHCRLELEHQRTYFNGGKDGVGLFVPYPRFPRLTAYVEEFGLEDYRTTAHLWNDIVAYLDDVKATIPHYYEVRFEDLTAAPAERFAEILDFCELPAVPSSNTAFWDKIRSVGHVSHTNRYSNFEQIQEICRANLQKHGYLS